ncbi:MAG: hypothetical protein HC903_09185 [Methylacidiphilales bacterium]|nr:hypothetical protein [Candidatus Methylacidiphilales bacterium]NJR16474.1 hypothetical protein [Calothrix sp. CSU_2_0]
MLSRFFPCDVPFIDVTFSVDFGLDCDRGRDVWIGFTMSFLSMPKSYIFSYV